MTTSVLNTSISFADETTFAALVRKHQHELQSHCYRMLGSHQESEDLVQETFLRAWRSIDRFEGRSSVRTWLYRIATNACINAIDARSRRVPPYLPNASNDSRTRQPQRIDIRWLEPYPDPAFEVIDHETVELAFLAAIRHLPARQRAVFFLCDVVGWQAGETAELLNSSLPSIRSALQRARATLRKRLPEQRADWTVEPTDGERAILRQYLTVVARRPSATAG